MSLGGGTHCSHGGGITAFAPDVTTETQTDALLRRRHLLLPLTLATAVFLYAGIAECAVLYESGWWVAIIPAAFLSHAFLIVTVHEGTHRSITGTAADPLITNVAAGLLLLPFYAEPFRAAHLAHHRHTNCEHDPLWPPFKEAIFHRSRALYMLGECLPLAFTLGALVRRRGPRSATPLPSLATALRIALAVCATGIVLVSAAPAPGFAAGTAIALGILSSLRHWCEHTGTKPGRESNTFRFPLGMGIGNHRVHHLRPSVSWLALALGLWKREKETGPLRSAWSMIRDPRHVHYREPT